jgi:hypothetical protein
LQFTGVWLHTPEPDEEQEQESLVHKLPSSHHTVSYWHFPIDASHQAFTQQSVVSPHSQSEVQQPGFVLCTHCPFAQKSSVQGMPSSHSQFAPQHPGIVS